MHQLDVALQYPWNWKVWRVVRRMLPYMLCSSANLSITRHWAGVMMPPGRRARSMTLCRGSSFLGAARPADVAVILLIHAVEADQLEVVAVEAAGERVLQILRRWCHAGSCLALEAFVVGQRPFDRSRNSFCSSVDIPDNAGTTQFIQILFCRPHGSCGRVGQSLPAGLPAHPGHVVGVAADIEVSACFQPLVELGPPRADGPAHKSCWPIPAEGQDLGQQARISHNAATPPDRGKSWVKWGCRRRASSALVPWASCPAGRRGTGNAGARAHHDDGGVGLAGRRKLSLCSTNTRTSASSGRRSAR